MNTTDCLFYKNHNLYYPHHIPQKDWIVSLLVCMTAHLDGFTFKQIENQRRQRKCCAAINMRPR
jgi:hypothetical protein